MFKRIISLLCVLCISMGLINIHSVFASDTALSAVSDNTAYKVGDKVNVNFDISNNQGFAALQFDIDFDSSMLKYVSHEFGSIKGGSYFDAQVNENNIVVGTMDFMSNIGGNGTVITVTFEAIANGTSNIGISNEVMSAIDDNSATGTVKLSLITNNTTINVPKENNSTTTQLTTTTEATTKATVTTTEKQTEATTKATVTTTEKQTEATTKTTVTTTEKQTETTTKKISSSGGSSGAGASSVKVSGYVGTTTTEATTEATTKAVKSEQTTEATTEKTISVNDVKVTIGNKTVVIGDEGYDVDAAPYIQAASNSTLVPLRFVAIAIEGGDIDNADKSDSIVWDSIAKTAIIIFEGKTIKFTAGSEIMVIDSKPQTMENGVKAEITGGRMFVPFRALGNALGVAVDWNANTKTAIYRSK